ncbi:MAG TPA: von Willebrand factor type A domain-containing protein [Chthoniobacterales bacterium]|nr:von Willebrand factor type A domain-containing protein [Chthoniobacterales bacterium]
MKVNLDDPNLTAFALGELDPDEHAKMANAIADSPEAQSYVAETQQCARLLRAEYETDRQQPADAVPEKRRQLTSVIWTEEQRRSSTRYQWGSLAAVLAMFAVIAAVAITTIQRESGKLPKRIADDRKSAPAAPVEAIPEPTVEMDIAQQPVLPLEVPPAVAPTTAPEFIEEKPSAGLSAAGKNRKLNPAAPPAPMPMAKSMASNAYGYSSGAGETRETEPPSRYRQDFDTATYDKVEENPFLPAATNPLSTFSIDVDTASYANVRRFINSGSLPPKDAVRVEEMINYFAYDYREPEGDKPFSIDLDATSCPWESSHRLLRIGLKGREVANEKRPASNLVFLLDVSGSMTPAERLPLVKQAMRLLVDKLTENDRVAIVIYAGGSGLALKSTPGNEKEKILQALEELQAGGSTNGAEGIELAYKIAAENFIKGGVNRVILATDGDFNIGVTNQGDLIRLIEAKAKTGVFLSVLGVGTDNLKDSTMQKLADKGNGNYAYLDSVEEARKVLVHQINGTLMTIAKDVKIQVEFNPARVASYRLIGYEKRLLRKEDFNNDKVDAGEIGAGHTVTALYEIVPANADATNPAASVPPVDPLKYQTATSPTARANFDVIASPEMVTVKLRHKKPDGDVSELTEKAFTDNGSKFENAAPDLKFAAAVAEFGMLLRDSQFKGKGTMGAVIEWAQEGKGRDAAGYRAGFIEMARKAEKLKSREG